MDDKTRIILPGQGANKSPQDSGDDATVFAPSKSSTAKAPPKTAENPDATVFAPVTGRHQHSYSSTGAGSAQGSSANTISNASAQNPDATVFLGTPQASVANAAAPASGVVGAQAQPHPLSQPSTQAETVNKTVIKGRFELESLLGVGGMGAVYKALDRRKVEASDSEPYVAVKLLNEDFKAHPDAFVSLQREARKSQTLAHPSIVTVYDFDRDGDMVFMTMEYLEGAPLDQLLKDHPHGLEPEAAESIIKDISNALIYAHKHNIVHSDFKPGNIFATNEKGAKVFDFGIARAVSEGGPAHSAGEKTVFDAGSLGALTPTYASYEMLKGKVPAPSDDVYALACVAYELYTGKHPFNKTPADQAFEQKLKPKRIKGLSRRKWRALEKGLAFKREQRTETVEAFHDQFFGRARTLLWLSAFAIVAAALVGVFYIENYGDQAEVEQQLKLEMEQRIEQERLQSQISGKRDSLAQIIRLATLTEDWDNNARQELDAYQQLAPLDAELPAYITKQVGELYLERARALSDQGVLEQVEPVLLAAESWQAEDSKVNAIRLAVRAMQEADRQQKEQARLAREKEAAEVAAAERRKRDAALRLSRGEAIETELSGLENAMRCRSGMNVSGSITTHLLALEKLDPSRSAQVRQVVAAELASCFNKVAKKSPSAAEKMLKSARVLLPNQAALVPLKVDYCSHLAPGTGGKGRRYTCYDKLPGGVKGPAMVVVPGPQGKSLAISKYEISQADIALFCKAGSCGSAKVASNKLPAHNLSVDSAKQYAAWLSRLTGNKYRLPSHAEWLLAAKARNESEEPDRNCHLKYGGIEKGVNLVKVSTGKNNSYGLVNHVGNVQEWVTQGAKLAVAGGSRVEPMSSCKLSLVKPHSGKPDPVTGFRLVRELNR